MAATVIASGTVSSLRIHRPTWRDMQKNYPGERTKSAIFYSMVGKSYAMLAAAHPESYANTCATRMSYALNRSGLKLPVAPNGGSLRGDDNLNYWLRVSQLSSKLKTHLGEPDQKISFEKIIRTSESEKLRKRLEIARDFISNIKEKKGIVVFEVSGWSDATGHFTLWDGRDLLYVGEGFHNDPTSAEYYFWLYRTFITDKIEVQTHKVLFWELR